MYKEITRPSLWVLDTKNELPDTVGQTVISPIHYGETIEINLVRGIEGETFINGKKFTYKEKNVFFIPPKYLHYSVFRKGGLKLGDMVCAFHINVKELAPFINLKNLLLKDNRTIFDLAFRCEDFDSIFDTIMEIIDDKRSFISQSASLLKLFELISSKKTSEELPIKYGKEANRLIEFVEENYFKKITIESVASYFGYSKQYFCKWFKKETGVTFNRFLVAVRIHHARTYLEQGYLIEETSELCGFSDPSYFTKVFKQVVGVTPKSYALEFKKSQT